ncbi:hypothetical protein PAXRUDRAFT_163745 [Paxillus rubicundulus Ve08.2h10]|uniref:Uncharacterized protein n=1 Tax=Paxillus rubicundulus Ve08.2h10 TaxID=930991 RepID=A0A0D0CT42_9AGAM|nr:hypothetical protein PAXRUDRAFT_163745 [Paxillus rubicundulus Ve08.2h10]
MSVSIKPGEEFLHTPKLAADGENWIMYRDFMYRDCLQFSIAAQGLLSHLDGTETVPTDPKMLVVYKKTLKDWQINEAITKQLIARTIPNTLFSKIKMILTAHGIFTHLLKLFEQHSGIISIQIQQKMQALKCSDKGNVREHFEKLHSFCEQLASMGQDPMDQAFSAVIVRSLPAYYDPQISAMMGVAKSSSTPLTSNTLIEAIQDKYNC